MNLQQLEYFLASFDRGSFSAAADMLHLAQPSVSEQVRALESELGVALFTRVGSGGNYLTEVLPAVTVLGLGLATTVAPLTVTVLAAAPARHAGMASAVNNDVARAAGLIAVSVLPAAAWPHWRRDWKVSNTTGRCVLPGQFAILSRFYLAVGVRR